MEKICLSSHDLKTVNKGIDCNGEDSGVETAFVRMTITFIEKCQLLFKNCVHMFLNTFLESQ